MKRRAKRLVLLLAAAVLAGAWLVTAYLAKEQTEAEAAPVLAEKEGYDLSIGTQKEMTALSWAWNGKTVNLDRDARGRWENAEAEDCPIDNAAAGVLARAAASVTAATRIDGVTDFAPYGLDEPSLRVMAAAGEAIVSYEVGNMTITGEYYLRVDHGSEVYLENGGLASAFRTDLTELLETESLPADIARVTGLAVETDAESYELTRAPEGDGWLRTDSEPTETLEPGRIDTLCELLLATDLGDCVAWDAAESYGFDAPQGSVAVTFEDTEGRTRSFSLEFGDYDGREVYVRFAGSALVYRTSAAALDALMYPDWEAMRPLTVLEADTDAITALTIELDGHEYHVDRLRETEDSEVIYSANGWILDTKKTDAWLRKLAGLTAESAVASKEGRERLFSVTVTVKTGEEEPADYPLEFWQYDSGHALCVTAERSLLLPRETAQALREDLEAILVTE